MAGIFFWICGIIAILTINNYYFSDSFFSTLIRDNTGELYHYNLWLLYSTTTILGIATLHAYCYLFKNKKQFVLGGIFLFLAGICLILSFQNNTTSNQQLIKPNVIFIGLDSLRPDFTTYFGNKTIHTPNIDALLKTSTVYNHAYTPLARTFPSWMSILTARYPKNNNARSNLANPENIYPQDNLAKQLKKFGYETTYGTDEKRFSNISKEYGFDHLIGPSMGVNDFILGGLTDFPLTNLLINTPIGRIIFPYQYANRAAAITYMPDVFLKLIQRSLDTLNTNHPQFIAVHFCLSHWPYTWAHDGQSNKNNMAQRYQHSVEGVDQQLGEFLNLLKQKGLLENAVVVLLSDHGTTIGLPNDRLISKNNYRGDTKKIKWVSVYKLGSLANPKADFKDSYSIDTSYGQGTDVLSLKQNHILLAFHYFGKNEKPLQIDKPASTLDISPTILEILHLPTFKKTDGSSLLQNNTLRPLFFETGYSLAEIETPSIDINAVIHKSIQSYEINPTNGQLYIKANAEQAVIHSKQRAVMLGDWLLARYPASTQTKLTMHNKEGNPGLENFTLPAYFVLVNLKSGLWTIGLTDSFAKNAPVDKLLNEFNVFYGDEIKK